MGTEPIAVMHGEQEDEPDMSDDEYIQNYLYRSIH